MRFVVITSASERCRSLSKGPPHYMALLRALSLPGLSCFSLLLSLASAYTLFRSMGPRAFGGSSTSTGAEVVNG